MINDGFHITATVAMVEQYEFDNAITILCSERSLEAQVEEAGSLLVGLCVSGEIRDVEWNTESSSGNTLYHAIFSRLHRIWQNSGLSKSISKAESRILRTWGGIVLLPEYDAIAAFSDSALTHTFVERAIRRIMALSKAVDKPIATGEDNSLPVASAIYILQQLVVRAYDARFDLRVQIRNHLVKYLLCVNQNSKKETVNNADGGTSRGHVFFLLKVLQVIISGFQTTNDREIYLQRRELLVDVLIPLHLPNEMVEWRDQIPVVQTYHEALVQCVVLLAEKTDEGYYHQRPLHSRSNDSLLTESLLQILRHWPDSYNTNTPKQVLLLHEIEILLERFDVSRLLPVQDLLLDRLMKCVGTNADNIRPAQRALQIFKNHKVMQVLFPEVPSGGNSTSSSHKDVDSKGSSPPTSLSLSAEEAAVHLNVARKTLGVLIPAFYRSGQASWNPTVNKMTALALKCFVDKNEALVREAAHMIFGSSHIVAGPRTQQLSSSKDGPEAGKDRRSMLPPMGGGIGSGGGKKKAFDAVARMPGASVNPSSTPSVLPPSLRTKLSGDAAFRSGAAPVSISSMPTVVPRQQQQQQPGASSLSNNASGRVNPPVTITGVAPWAMKPPTDNNSNIHSSSSGNSNNMGTVRMMLPPHVTPHNSDHTNDNKDVAMMLGLNTVRRSSGGMLPPVPSNLHGTRPTGALSSTIADDKRQQQRQQQQQQVREHLLRSLKDNVMDEEHEEVDSKNNDEDEDGDEDDFDSFDEKSPVVGYIGKRRLPHQQESHDYTLVADAKDAMIVGADGTTSMVIGDEGYARLCEYMTRLYPQVFSGEEDTGAQSKEWCVEQAAATPMLLPTLKFHDLVFGQVLGEGAFSTVKYARHITKGKAQSAWPEYAVKIVDAQRVLSLHYASSVLREIAILHLVQFANIARMVSSFHYRGSAYLVLEYAQRGDLHTFLLKCGHQSHAQSSHHGSIGGYLMQHHAWLRFVVGEIAAAVQVLHAHGFVYNDLKPENVLLTEMGHVKITDFGACRPYTKEAHRQVQEACTALLQLRDGNWKQTASSKASSQSAATAVDHKRGITSQADGKVEAAEDEDVPDGFYWRAIVQEGGGEMGESGLDFKQSDRYGKAHVQQQEQQQQQRCEGTPAYLPPEAFSTTSSATSSGLYSNGTDPLQDAWALGCLLHFCYYGKPRFFGEEVDEIRAQQSIWFEERAEKEQDVGGHVHFTRANQSDTGGGNVQQAQSEACLDLLHSLLTCRDRRMSIEAVLDHPYLTSGLLALPISTSSSTTSATTITSLTDHFGGEPLPVSYAPRSLHLLRAQDLPRWPEPVAQADGSGGSSSGGWARRQFSTLWAPMPKPYDLSGGSVASTTNNDNSNHSNGNSPGKRGGGGDNGLMAISVLRVPLPVVIESDVERASSFLSRE